jgi:hypothetical protein
LRQKLFPTFTQQLQNDIWKIAKIFAKEKIMQGGRRLYKNDQFQTTGGK